MLSIAEMKKMKKAESKRDASGEQSFHSISHSHRCLMINDHFGNHKGHDTAEAQKPDPWQHRYAVMYIPMNARVQ